MGGARTADNVRRYNRLLSKLRACNMEYTIEMDFVSERIAEGWGGVVSTTGDRRRGRSSKTRDPQHITRKQPLRYQAEYSHSRS